VRGEFYRAKRFYQRDCVPRSADIKVLYEGYAGGAVRESLQHERFGIDGPLQKKSNGRVFWRGRQRIKERLYKPRKGESRRAVAIRHDYT
jgi:hypothetical protein